jgi:hypothetical protein
MHFRFVVFFYLFIFLFSEDTYLRWPHVYIMLCVLCIEVLETDDEYYVFNTVGLVIYIHTYMYIRTKTVLRSYKWAHTYIYHTYIKIVIIIFICSTTTAGCIMLTLQFRIQYYIYAYIRAFAVSRILWW